MKLRLSAMLASSSLMVLATTLPAQAQPAPPQRAALDVGEEIIVTARRKAESLQDVPQTVSAVTGESLQELKIYKFYDLEQVVAGIQMTTAGFNASSARGVTFNVASAAFAPTVGMYINDAPTITSALFQSIYDIGQIEVLRGPQGTVRGIANPSGAITITTKRPDLTSVGGYADLSITNLDGRNFQGAVSVPIVPEKLAIRIAGLLDENDGTGIVSVTGRAEPSEKVSSARVSVRFEPTEFITANVMYQTLKRSLVTYGGAVFGTGSPGGGSTNQPPNYNGPAIGMFDRATASDLPGVDKNLVNLLTGNLSWDFAGQRLSYVGAYTDYVLKTWAGGSGSANTLPGYHSPAQNRTPNKVQTHELRLSSVDRIGGTFDYVIGGFYQFDEVNTQVNNGTAALLSGFFGAPGTVANPRVFNTRYQLETLISSPRNAREMSFFGNVTAHLMDDRLEVSGGVRRIVSRVRRITDIKLTRAFNATAGLPAGTCTAIGGQFGATYPGVCDIPVGGTQAVPFSDVHFRHAPWVYSASISFKINPDLMVYANTGSSWREGPYTVGINNFTNNATLNSLTFLSPEKSKSYEVGGKWSFLDRRGRLNVAYYHQTYDGLIFTSPFGINYDSGNTTGTRVNQYSFNSNAPAKVDGIDLELSFQATEQWSMSGNVSWANGRLSNASIPCNDSNFDGTPDTGVPPSNASTFIAAGRTVAFCNSNASTSTAPRWNFRVQSEFNMPVTSSLDAYVRGLLAYQPKNPNANQTYVIPAYATLNLYLGLRDPERNWEVSLWAKNLTGTRKITSIGSSAILPFQTSTTTPLFGPSGYTTIALTPRREFGLSLRYAFGGG